MGNGTSEGTTDDATGIHATTASVHPHALRQPCSATAAGPFKGMDDAGARPELQGQIPHFQEIHVRILGSMMSRRPSPSRLKVNTASISTAPGKSATHHSPEMM